MLSIVYFDCRLVLAEMHEKKIGLSQSHHTRSLTTSGDETADCVVDVDRGRGTWLGASYSWAGFTALAQARGMWVVAYPRGTECHSPL